jgi:hypothetical protein
VRLRLRPGKLGLCQDAAGEIGATSPQALESRPAATILSRQAPGSGVTWATLVPRSVEVLGAMGAIDNS